MSPVTAVLQFGLPEFLPDLVGIAGTVVLLLMIVALAGIAYRMATGGIEWPDEREDDDTVHRSHDDDDEWEFY